MRFATLACAAAVMLCQAAAPAAVHADEMPVKVPAKRVVRHAAPVPPMDMVAVPVRTVCDEVVEGLYAFRNGSPAQVDTYEVPRPSLDKGPWRRPVLSPFKGYVADFPPGRPDPKPMPRLLCGKGEAIDGNTIRLGRQSFRLFGLQAPSVGETCPNTRGGRWDCGTSAKRELQRRLSFGYVVCQGVDAEGDAIFSAHCEIDHRDIGADMVRNGFASANYRDTPEYVQREGEAVRASRGMWEAYAPSFDSGGAVGASAIPHERNR